MTLYQGYFWAAGERGSLWRSLDGLRWENQPSPYPGSFFGLLNLPSGELLLFGLRGKIFRGNGEAWTEIPNPSDASLLSGTLIPHGRVVLAGLEGIWLASSDQAKSFQKLNILSEQENITAVAHGSKSNVLILATEKGLQRLS